MPSVPRVKEQSVRQDPLPNVRLTPQADESTFGGGPSLDKVGAAANDLAGVGFKLALQAKNSADDTAVTEADTEAGIIQTNMESDISKMRGRTSAGAIDAVNTSWPKLMEPIQKRLNNDEQRALFQKKNATRYLSTLETAKKWTVAEGERYQTAVTDGAIKQWDSYAVQNFDNKDKVDESLFAMSQERIKHALSHGLATINQDGTVNLDPEARSLISEEVGSSAAKVYNRLLEAGRKDEAEAHRKKYESLPFSSEDIISMDKTRDSVVKKLETERKDALEATMQVNGDKIITEAQAGKFDDLAELERRRGDGLKGLPTGITSEDYTWVNHYLTTDAYIATKEQRNELSFGIPDEYFKMNDYKSIAKFRMAALEARKGGIITELEMQGKLAQVEKAFNKGVTSEAYRSGQKIWGFSQGWFEKHLSGLKVSVGGKIVKQPLTKEAQQDALGYVGNELMKYMANHEIKDEDIPKLSNMLLAKWATIEYPELTGKSELPTAVMDMESNFKRVYAGKTKATPDFVVQNVDLKKIPHDPNTEKVQVDTVSGKWRIVKK